MDCLTITKKTEDVMKSDDEDVLVTQPMRSVSRCVLRSPAGFVEAVLVLSVALRDFSTDFYAKLASFLCHSKNSFEANTVSKSATLRNSESMVEFMLLNTILCK